MDRYVGKTVKIVMEQLFGSTVKVQGELLEAGEDGWVVKTTHWGIPKDLKFLEEEGYNIVYIPHRLILLATLEE